MVELSYPSAAEWLRGEYCKRRNENDRYSVRAFARRLGLAPGAVSEMMSARRPITTKTAVRIADRLELRPEARRHLLSLVGGRLPATKRSKKLGIHFIEADSFSIIADWYHFAILGVMKLDRFRSSSPWIAKRLGISRVEADIALDRLDRLGLIERKGKRWRRTHACLTTTTDIPSAALRLSHKQTLKQAIEAIDEVPVERRDVTSVSVALDPAQLDQAKDLIRDFRQRMLELLECGPKTELYNLNIQLVPVTKPEEP